MHTGQALFPLRIEPDIPRICPWKKLLATGAQAIFFINGNTILLLFFATEHMNVF